MASFNTSIWFRRGLLAAAVCALAGCVVVPADQYYRGYGETVMTAPPPDQSEVIGVAPAPGYFWIGGYWNWVGGRHAWVGGRWEANRPGYAWAPHRWYRDGRGWRAAPGHWQRR